MPVALGWLLLCACASAAQAFIPGAVHSPHARVRAVVSGRPDASHPRRGVQAKAFPVRRQDPPPVEFVYAPHPPAPEQPVRAIKVVEEWERIASLEALWSDSSGKNVSKQLSLSRDNLAAMRAAIEARTPAHVFGITTPEEGTAGDGVLAIAMVTYHPFEDKLGRLADLARRQGLAPSGGTGAAAAVEIAAFVVRPAVDQTYRGCKPQLLRRIANWAATKDCLVAYNPAGILGRRVFHGSGLFDAVDGHEPYMVFTGSRWVHPDFHMIELEHDGREASEERLHRGREGDGGEMHGREDAAKIVGRLAREERSREDAAELVGRWARMADTLEARDVEAQQFKVSDVLVPAEANLRAMLAAVWSGAPVHMFALTTNGDIGGAQAIAMVRPTILADPSGQLAIVAREQGVVLAPPPGGEEGSVAVMEIVAYAAKPAAKPEGARTQIVRRISSWAAARNHLVMYSPAGVLGTTFCYFMAFETIGGHEPYKVFTGSGWALRKYSLITLL